MADTKGRTRAAKQKAKKLMKETMRQDDEVDFHPQYEEEVSRFNRSHDVSSNHTSASANTAESAGSSAAILNSSSARVEALENDMGQVKRKVDNIDAKLDLILAAANPATRTSTPRRPASKRDGQAQSLPPPRRLLQEENADGYVDQILQQERFRPAQVEGKAHLASDAFIENLIPKPYMYVSREGVQTLKQKLENRSSTTPMQYVNATIALLNDPRAFHPEDRSHILRHLQDVTHDIMERPWEDVRSGHNIYGT